MICQDLSRSVKICQDLSSAKRRPFQLKLLLWTCLILFEHVWTLTWRSKCQDGELVAPGLEVNKRSTRHNKASRSAFTVNSAFSMEISWITSACIPAHEHTIQHPTDSTNLHFRWRHLTQPQVTKSTNRNLLAAIPNHWQQSTKS